MATGSLVFGLNWKSAAKVLLLTHTDWIVCAYYPLFFEKNAKKKDNRSVVFVSILYGRVF